MVVAKVEAVIAPVLAETVDAKYGLIPLILDGA